MQTTTIENIDEKNMEKVTEARVISIISGVLLGVELHMAGFVPCLKLAVPASMTMSTIS